MICIPEEIKTLFRTGSTRKNIRVHFPNGEHEDITNSNIVAESFSFTESLCSRDILKFGLCEASMVEFETKGIGNIKNMEIQCQIEIDISSMDDDFISENGHVSDDVPFPFYPIKFGYFTVDSCPNDNISDIERRNVKAYDKLVSQSLDYDKTDQLNNYLKSKPACVPQNVYTLEKMMLQDFNINHERTMVPVAESEKPGLVTSTTYIGQPTATCPNAYTVTTNLVILGGINSTEIYNIIFSNLSEFTWVHDDMKNYQKEYNITFAAVRQWFDDSGLRIAITDTNHNIATFTEKDAIGDVLSILDKGNIVEFSFEYVYSYSMTFEDRTGELQTLSRTMKKAQGDALLKYIAIEKIELYDIEKKAIPPVLTSCTLRNVLNAVYEINGTFATINRESGMLEERNIADFGLYPSETLYPSADLYPQSASSILPQGRYIQAKHDDEEVKPYGKIIAHYKTTDAEGQTIDAVYEHFFREGITYNLNSNWILQNCIFTEEEVAALCEYMAEKISHIKYTPCTVTAKGLPWIEAGDTIDVLTKKGGFESIILRRTLSGIQGLVDDIEAKGKE